MLSPVQYDFNAESSVRFRRVELLVVGSAFKSLGVQGPSGWTVTLEEETLAYESKRYV